MTTPDSIETTDRPLLDWLLSKFPETPKKRAKQWITAGRVSVNGIILRKPHELMADPGAALQLLGQHSTTLDCGPGGWQIHPRVNLLYLDAALAVVNKGPGLLSVPSEPGELSALSILADFLKGKLRAYDRGIVGRTLPPTYRQLEPLPVHRLDQYTSGVFCMGMSPVARKHLIEQLKAHTMRREYVAYVEGKPAPPQGTWKNWLKLSEDELKQYIISAAEAKDPKVEAQEAITHYEVITEFPKAGVSKLRLRLETGRKHQIRAQAAYAGVPLVGDRTYHPKYHADAPRPPRIEFERQALHAEVLTLKHPLKSDLEMSWTAALPKDLAKLENELHTSHS